MTDPEPLATIPAEDAAQFDPNGPGDLDVVRIYNPELGAYGESPRAGLKYLEGWEVVDPTPEEAEALTDYDPAAHTIGEIEQHLDEHPGELDAVLVLEREGKARPTLIAALEKRQGDVGDGDQPES